MLFVSFAQLSHTNSSVSLPKSPINKVFCTSPTRHDFFWLRWAVAFLHQMLCSVIREKKCWKLCDPQEFPSVAGSSLKHSLLLHHCTWRIWKNSGNTEQMFISLDTSIQLFWLRRRRQVVCMWYLHHFCRDASTASGGCVLGCSVRQQGMALNNQSSGHNSMWAAIPTWGWIILWNTLIGSCWSCTQDQFSLQQSKLCQGKWWQAWDKEWEKVELSHHLLYTADKALVGGMWGSGGWLQMEGLGQEELTGEQGRMEILTHPSSAMPSRATFPKVSLSLHSLGIRGLSWGYDCICLFLWLGKKSTIDTWLESL